MPDSKMNLLEIVGTTNLYLVKLASKETAGGTKTGILHEIHIAEAPPHLEDMHLRMVIDSQDEIL